MNRRGFFRRLVPVGAVAAVAGCRAAPAPRLVEAFQPYCAACGAALLAPSDWRPLRDRLEPAPAEFPCLCGKVWITTFWRALP